MSAKQKETVPGFRRAAKAVFTRAGRNMPDGDCAPQLREIARTAPAVVAGVVDGYITRAAREWERGNNSGNSATMTACNARSDHFQAVGVALAFATGVEGVSWPGLFPVWKVGRYEHYSTLSALRALVTG